MYTQNPGWEGKDDFTKEFETTKGQVEEAASNSLERERELRMELGQFSMEES